MGCFESVRISEAKECSAQWELFSITDNIKGTYYM